MRTKKWHREIYEMKDLVPNDTLQSHSYYTESSLLWILKMPILSMRQIRFLSFRLPRQTE